MTVTHGADVDRLEQAATALEEQGRRLDGLTQQGGAMLDLLSGSWSGADVEQFAGDWRASEAGLRRATTALEGCARDLEQQAQQQDATSQGSSSPGGGGSGSSPSPGTSAPPPRASLPTASLPTGAGVDPTTAGTRPTINVPSCDELSQDDLDRIEREEQIDTDAPIVLETGDGKINAAEAGVMAFFLAIGGQEMVENMFDIKREADGAGEEAYPDQGLDQQEDAFRHAYWNARMTQDHSEKAAEMLANAHEMHEDPTPLDDKREAMDLHNNEVARRIAMEHPDASPEELKKHIDEAVRCGEMVCIDEDGNLQPSNYNL